ncbi:uncharacterized protein LOC127101421 [Lathyrus oleraceus]|uniref:Uncharacterized protein n=1 Tax=Pisum sativum TaxID=3888 RepID=A0A9D4VP53_PEA|nr:uncharacterized protein LOC127101421 [Pisum sativum]KAI5386838.1 hypothetical protein KIW84_073109 [Pisum sativum]
MDMAVVKVEYVPDEKIDTASAKDFEDAEVDILSLTNKVDVGSNKNEDPDATDPDATEYSSSFGETDSDGENRSRPSDAEVESEFFGENGVAGGSDSARPGFRPRKRKLTDHWRSYIRPLMWRLKWTEIRLKQVESQALKYTRKLKECEKEKHRVPDGFNMEESGSKSVPYTSHQYRRKARRRRNRKKVEKSTDIASYTAHHYLFSYLESKKADRESSLDDDFENPVIIEPPHAESTEKREDQPLLKCTNVDVSYEQLLWNIDNLHNRVRTLKSGINAITSRNASKFSESENFSLVPYGGEVQTGSAQSPTNSVGNEYTASVGVGGVFNSSQNAADEYDFGDFVFPDSAVSSFGEASNIPDIIESTVGLLAAAEVTLQSALVAESGEHMVESKDVLLQDFKTATHNPVKLADVKTEVEADGSAEKVTEKLKEIKVEVCEGSHSASIHISAATATAGASQEQSALQNNKDAGIPISKKKRGERKAGSGGWNK